MYYSLEFSANFVGYALVVLVVLKVVLSMEYSKKPPKLWLAIARAPVIRALLNTLKAFIVNVFPALYDVVAKSLSQYSNTRKEFPASFRAQYEALFSKTFGVEPRAAHSNNFWYSYMYVRERSTILGSIAMRLLRLYGLVRNLSTALYIAFLYGFLWLMFQLESFLYLGIYPGKDYKLTVLLSLPLFYFVAAFLLLIRYYYLRVPYFSKFVFRAFVYLCRVQPKPHARRRSPGKD